jgi:hypothetical protein
LPSRRFAVLVALFASLVVHGVIGLLMMRAAEDDPDSEPDPWAAIDVDIAPEAPEGFDPVEAQAASASDKPEVIPEPEAEAGTTLEPEPEPESELSAEHPADAGPEAEPALASSGAQSESESESESETESESESESETESESESESESETESESESGSESGTRSGSESGTGDGAATGDGEGTPIGAAADFRPYIPGRDKVAVLLRYDRLRGTPWSKLADAILAPMPDYRAIIGDRKIPLEDLFDVLLISSRNPMDVVATNLVATTRQTPSEIRRLLDHKLQRVTWRAVRGGVLGTRQPSAVKLERDTRHYLLPAPGVVVLTRAGHLGQPAREGISERDLDRVRADESALPEWLKRARHAGREAGDASGPIAVMSVTGIHRSSFEVPQIGRVPTPQHFALALEMAGTGFYLRGTLRFGSPERATEFQQVLEAAKGRLIGSRLGELMLRNFHVYHALKGLTLRRKGTLVTYATSISSADARAGMQLAADWARRFYAAQLDKAPLAPPREPAAKPPASPAPGDPGEAGGSP